MEAVLTYFIQVNVLLVLLYLGYLLLLRSLTFYKLNRSYFLLGGLFALCYPFLPIGALFSEHVEPVGELVAFLPGLLPSQPVEVVNISLQHVLLAIMTLGAALLLLKFFIQLGSLYRIHRNSVDASWREYIYRNVLFPIAPFSFFNRIYLNEAQHAEPELQDILAHEREHVKGHHTLDILLYECLIMLCWYNPLVWFMRKSVRQNLEFLTDQEVINTGVDKQAYQYALLHVAQQGEHVAIANQFNFKLLKSRIMMMNKKRSSSLALSKYLCLIPLIIFVAAAFTVTKADTKIAEVVQLTQQTVIHTAAQEVVAEVDTVVSPQDTIKKAAKKVTGSVMGVTVKADGTVETLAGDSLITGGKAVVRLGPVRQEGQLPLVVVNGVKKPLTFNIQELHADDIAQVNILKGETATATYGAEAKDGVISITLKGHQGKSEGEVKGFQVQTVKGLEVGTGRLADTKRPTITIRSRGANDPNPLIVIDGVPVEPAGYKLEDLNPNSIESITVIKDEKSLALYGDKAKDGVVFITTREGKAQ